MNRIIVLEDPFDPYDLPAGYYTAYSDTEAYPTLWSMVNIGMAHDEGVRYLEGGVVQMMASYEMPPLERNPEDDEYEEAMIIIPHSAYTRVTRDYSNWRQMWWREVIQNSIDAGATMIDCRTEEQEDGTWLVSCQDDGSGMSYDTMMNAFFTIGGTEKPQYARGGFGEAKKLIALAWIKYRVHSRDILVEGTGAEFPKLKVYRNVEIIKGTKVEVVMPADKHTTDIAAIEYISRCQLPDVKFFVNGDPVKADLDRGEKRKRLSRRAQLFYNDSVEDIHALLVRSNGLYMFDKPLSSDFKGVIIVEVYTRPAERGGPTVDQLFLSSRMDLKKGRLKKEVERVYTQAEFDLSAALRSPDALFRKSYNIRGLFTIDTAVNREAIIREVAGPLPEIKGGGGLEMMPEMLTALIEQFREFEAQAIKESRGDPSRLISVISPEEAEIMLGTLFKGESDLEVNIRQLVWQPNFINMNDETTRKNFELDRKFDPLFMTGPIYAIARLWTAFVRFIAAKSRTYRRWGVGFVFSREAQGVHWYDGRKSWICLNPINLRNRSKLLNIRDAGDVRVIFEVAMHECAHFLGADIHGDAFIRAYGDIVEDMLQYWNKAKRIAKKVKIRGVVKKIPKSEVPETVRTVITPLAENIALFEVEDESAIKYFKKALGLDGRNLRFYLYGDDLKPEFLEEEDDSIIKVKSYEKGGKRIADYRRSLPKQRLEPWTSIGESGWKKRPLIFEKDMDYSWVHKEVVRANIEPTGKIPDPLDEIPVRIVVMHDGSLFFEPDDAQNRFYFRQLFSKDGEITDASLRVRLTRNAQETSQALEELFFDNPMLTEWPYSARDESPGGLVNKLFTEGSVVIPLDKWVYSEMLANAVERPQPDVLDEEKVGVNFFRDSEGFYHVHPKYSEEYEFYQQRFDTGPEFDLILDKGQESGQFVKSIVDFDKKLLDEGNVLSNFFGASVFENWLYNHDYKGDLRRPDWAPKMVDETALMVANNIFVYARNLGREIVSLEFNGPHYQGEAIARQYNLKRMSELILFVNSSQMKTLLVAIEDEPDSNLLRQFWTACAPGTISMRLSANVFIQGISPQFRGRRRKPGVSCPVWLHFVEGMLTIKPFLVLHEAWFRSKRYGEGFAVILDTSRAETIARQILQSTFNCGKTPSGLEAAQYEFEKLVNEGHPVLAAIATSDLTQLIQEG